MGSFAEQLPRVIDVVRYFFHFKNLNDSERFGVTAREIQKIYQRAEIPTIQLESIRSKVKKTVAQVKSIVETRKSNRQSQIEKEFALFEKLLCLFEVAQNETSLSMARVDFLAEQRTTRRLLLTSLPVTIHFDQQASTSGVQEHLLAVDCTDSFGSGSTFNLQRKMSQSSSSISEDGLDFDQSPDFLPSCADKKLKKIQLSDSDKNDLSKCGGSYRVIEKVLAIGIKSAGGNPNEYAISKSALCSQLSSVRSSNKREILQQIASNNELAILHFDGKKYPKINQKHIGKDNRMVAVCHTPTKDIPLGLPILDGTGAESYANQLYELCEQNNMLSRIAGVNCDTTVTNTGIWAGACALFQDQIGMDVLNIMCRHHIFEVLLFSAFTTAFGTVGAPTITQFEDLKQNWSYIKRTNFSYQPYDPLDLESIYLQPLYVKAKEALLNHSKSKQIRDDYAELTDLCLKFFGVRTKKSFMVPGAVSKSRWMAKAIYAIKMYLFRELLKLDEEFERQLLEFSLFVTLIYCKHWNRCTNAIDVPANDLELIKELQEYSNYNELIANKVLESFENHLWYLEQELVIMSLFSDKVSVEDKNKMRLKITSSEFPLRDANSLRLQNYFDRMNLPKLVTPRSRFFFFVLKIS